MEECDCNREEFDLEEDEHFITCPVILTPAVLQQLGFDVREEKYGYGKIVKKKREKKREL